MRYTAEEKEEIIRVVKSSEISISESLRYLGIPKRSFYNWYHKYETVARHFASFGLDVRLDVLYISLIISTLACN